MKAIPFLLAVALLAPLSAQGQQGNPARPRTRVVQPPQQPAQAWPGQGEAAGENDEADRKLPESNFTISLEGTMTSGTAVDLQLTGSGPTFTAEQSIGEEGNLLSCAYNLSKTEKGYRISYTLGVQMRVATSVSSGENKTVNYQFRDVSLAGAILCTSGVPVVIARSAGKPLTLTVAELPEPGKATAAEKEH